eukprot:TRINITY_DN17092_c0_g1_i12.p1 TRINITY_DN17092_c0_g1~~TRINITY_DN17092_c0_g1_i12.p1  ORF type:complete len:411 (+),score=82.24 TRINITY_DN17092_c0_g1_i12:77-1309(+)
MCIRDSYKRKLVYFVVIPTVLLVVAALGNAFAIYRLHRTRKFLVSSLFSISSGQLDGLLKNAQNFMQMLRGREDFQEDDKSISGEYSQHTVQHTELTTKLKGNSSLTLGTRTLSRKSYKANYGEMACLVLKFLMLYILFGGFFVFFYFANLNWSSRLNAVKTELNETAQATIYFPISLTMTEDVILRQSNTNMNYLMNGFLSELIDRPDKIEFNHLQHGIKLSESFDNTYTMVTDSNLCELTNSNFKLLEDVDYCNSALSGIFSQGLLLALIYTKNYMISINTKALSLKENYENTDPDKYKEELIKLGNSRDTIYLFYSFPAVILPTIHLLLATFDDAVANLLDNNYRLQLIFLIIFICCIFIFELACIVIIWVNSKKMKELTLIVTLVPPQYAANSKVFVDILRQFSKY